MSTGAWARLGADTGRHKATIGFVVASIIWALVMISTGDVAWPLAVWMATALAPYAAHRRS